MNFLRNFFSPEGFMPHGHCYLWETEVMWLHIVSDALITLAYLTIPVTLIYIARKQKDLPFDWMFACFGMFILACGATHALEVWTIWDPVYRLSGTLKAITALASIATASLLIRLIPQLLAIPSIASLQAANEALAKEVVERQRAEAEIRELQSQQELILNSIAEGIHWIDSDSRIAFENPAAARMLGWEPAELIGRPAHATMHHTHGDGTAYPRAECPIYAGLHDGQPRSKVKEVFWRKDGTSFPVEYTSSPACNAAGEIAGTVVVFTDISERLANEERLLRQQTEMRVLFDLVPAMIWFKDTTNGILRVNQRVADAAGKTIEEIEGKPTHEIYPAEAAQFYADDLEVIRSGAPKLGFVESMLGSEGQQLWVRTDKVPYRDQHGDLVGIVVMAQDITERKQTEEALRRSEALFRTLVQTSWDAFHLIDCTGRILYESPAVTRVLGYTPEEMLGRNVLEFIHPEDAIRDLGGRHDLAHAPDQLRHLVQRVRHQDGSWRCIESYDVNLIAHPDVAAIAVNFRDITERVDTELAARRLVALVESSADAIIGTDIDGAITSWNTGAEKVFGYAAAEMLGTSIMRLVPPERKEDEIHIIGTVWGGQSVENFETQRLTKTGLVIDVALTASPIRDCDGEVVGVSKVARDITARKKAEAAAANLLTVLEASLNEIFIFDAETLRFEYVNECARRNLGYSMETMSALTPLDLTPEFSVESFGALVVPLRKHEAPKVVFETVHQRADGGLYPVEVHLQLVERSGKAVFLAVINDISERRRTEAALRGSEAEFRALAEAMPQMVWITDSEGRNIYQNQQWLDYTGQTLEESLGYGSSASLHPNDQERSALAWSEATANGDLYSAEFRIRRADGVYRWWLVRGVPQRTAAGKIRKWFGTCTDIHDLKEAELEIQHLNIDLERRVEQRTAELHAAPARGSTRRS